MGRPLRVLIVEDSEDDALLLVRELRQGGFDPVFRRVDTEEELIEALRAADWDVVLSDFAMPKYDGLSAFEIVHGRNPDLPFIFVSGRIGEQRAVDAMKRGVSDYVLKDHLARLVPAVQRELREAEQRRARRLAEAALRRSEAALHHQQRLLRTVFNSLPVWVTVKDRAGRYLLVNRARSEASGVPEQEWIGKTPSQLGGRPFAELEHVEALDREVMTSGQPREEPDFPVTTPEGKTRRLHVIRTPLRDEQGRVAGLVTVSQDITDRLRLEEQFQRAQRMESIGRLAGGVAHDFNNILAVILSFAELVLDQVREGDPARADLREIVGAAQRAAALTRQLLAFSRRQVQKLEILDLNGVIRDMERMLRRLIGEDIELVTRLTDPLDPVKADASQIEQIVMNLAVNARDAMPTGGKLIIETSNTELDEDYVLRHHGAAAGPHVMLTITDTGIGMPPEIQAKIFEPFFTTKEKGKGTGLGLATVYGIVKQSQGSIWVYSEPGRGTTFRIYFPRTGEEAAPAKRGKAVRPLAGTRTVLLVEDDEHVRKAALRILEQAGYRVLIASNGGEALRHAENEPGVIDLMLTDVIMPGISGRDLAERMQQLRPELRVLFMSGYTDDAIIHHGVLAEGVALLQKPFTRESLLDKVREVIAAAAG